jgi:hypothetical protein
MKSIVFLNNKIIVLQKIMLIRIKIVIQIIKIIKIIKIIIVVVILEE